MIKKVDSKSFEIEKSTECIFELPKSARIISILYKDYCLTEDADLTIIYDYNKGEKEFKAIQLIIVGIGEEFEHIHGFKHIGINADGSKVFYGREYNG